MKRLLYDSLMSSNYKRISKISISGLRRQPASELQSLVKVGGMAMYEKTTLTKIRQICIVTGPNKDLAIKLIKKVKEIFSVN